MRLFVTGSSGFIATHLIPRLTNRGATVVGLDEQRSEAADNGRFSARTGSILDPGDVAAGMIGADAVIHLAAEHADFGIDERAYHEVNVDGTSRLLEAAAEQDVRSFLFFSSVAVYGDIEGPTHEELTPRANTPYGRTKLEAEKLVEGWASRRADRCALIIRPTVIYGPYSHGNMHRLICQIARGRYLHVGEGSNIKSTGYIENLVDATLFLLDRMRPGVALYNYADEPHLTSRDIAQVLASALEVDLPSFSIPTGLARALATPLDLLAGLSGWNVPITGSRIAKLARTTHHLVDKLLRAGFRPHYTSREGLRRTAEWYSSVDQGKDQAPVRNAYPEGT